MRILDGPTNPNPLEFCQVEAEAAIHGVYRPSVPLALGRISIGSILLCRMTGEFLLECGYQFGGCWAPVLAMGNAAFDMVLIVRRKRDGDDIQLSVIPAHDLHIVVGETIAA